MPTSFHFERALGAVLSENAATLASQLLTRENPPPATLAAMAELCRRVGCLEHARDLLERLFAENPDFVDVTLTAVHALLAEGRSESSVDQDVLLPAPFVRVRDFLPADVHSRVLKIALSGIPAMIPSKIAGNNVEGVHDPSRRFSYRMPDTRDVHELIRPYLASLVQGSGIRERLGVDVVDTERLELEVTCYPDGAFYSAHRDVSSEVHQDRRLSFAYYFGLSPKRFKGGDLRLHDAPPHGHSFAEESFTCVNPEDNSVVLFPSTVIHQVAPVLSQDGTLESGRFAVSGWFRAVSPL